MRQLVTATVSIVDRVLDATASILLADGYAAVTHSSIARCATATPEEVAELFANPSDALVAVLNREFSAMYSSIVDQIERDPRGGLLSRIYLYLLPVVYERPLAKALFVLDRDALNQIMRHSHAFRYVPNIDSQTELVEQMQEAEMVRRDVNALAISHVITTWSAGLALTAPHEDLDTVVRGMSDLLSRAVDADVEDTTAGKAVFYEWATSLTLPERSDTER
jgi:hypothetical protein